MKKVTIKQVINSDTWILTKVIRGYSGMVRISAKTRFHVADETNLFCEWCTEKYADSLCQEEYGKKVAELNCFSYN